VPSSHRYQSSKLFPDPTPSSHQVQSSAQSIVSAAETCYIPFPELENSWELPPDSWGTPHDEGGYIPFAGREGIHDLTAPPINLFAPSQNTDRLFTNNGMASSDPFLSPAGFMPATSVSRLRHPSNFSAIYDLDAYSQYDFTGSAVIASVYGHEAGSCNPQTNANTFKPSSSIHIGIGHEPATLRQRQEQYPSSIESPVSDCASPPLTDQTATCAVFD